MPDRWNPGGVIPAPRSHEREGGEPRPPAPPISHVSVQVPGPRPYDWQTDDPDLC